MKIAFHMAILPPLAELWGTRQYLGFGYLSACLQRRFPGLEISCPFTEAQLLEGDADIVGLSCSTYNYAHARRVAAQLKQLRGATVVLGGPHVSVMPERMDREFDYGVLGEGEETMAELVGQLLESNPPKKPEEIDGLVFWRDDARVINSPRQLIEQLDSLPFPDRELFGTDEELNGREISAISSRGCPYNCSFCSTTKHWQRLRLHSAEYLVKELDEIIGRYQPSCIHYEDDLFIANRPRLEAVAEKILKRGYHQQVQFRVSGRANLLTPKVCELLKRINTKVVFIGLESNCDHVLQALGKRGITAEVNQRAVDNVTGAGMKIIGSFILGAPGETLDDAYKTYQFIHRNLEAFSCVHASVLRLLPGTELWRQALEKGLIDERLTGIVYEDEDFDGWHSLTHNYPMLCETMTRGELMAMLLAFNELERFVEEREKTAACRRELEQLHTRNIDAWGIKKTSAELARKLARRLGR